MKRKWLLRIGVPALVGFAGFALLLWFVNCPINQRNFDQIKTGMTVAEVQAFLGPPFGTIKSNTREDKQTAAKQELVRKRIEAEAKEDHLQRVQQEFQEFRDANKLDWSHVDGRDILRDANGADLTASYWIGEAGFIQIIFDADGKVWFAGFVALTEAIPAKLRRWLHVD